ncbi:MAG TPA: hypothetical protein VLN46_06010 [Gillisia sp.]|nr:hypothetical protein [Gillisia sp.]
MVKQGYRIKKASGKNVQFSLKRVEKSLRKAGTEESLIKEILEKLPSILSDNTSTRDVYNLAYKMLKKRNKLVASKYSLKQAIFALGPTGFPFERFIGAIFKDLNYKVEVGKEVQGKCVGHEVDVIAQDSGNINYMECKFHSDQGRKCNVKTPLYVHSRYSDILKAREMQHRDLSLVSNGWVVTNTRFTKDALIYARCVGLKLLSWDEPKGKGLKDLIDQTGLYPITVSLLLSEREKAFLLSRDIVLCKDLIDDKFYLDHLEVSQERKARIMQEMQNLCDVKRKSYGK